MNKITEKKLPRADFAEQVGVNSKELQAFIDDAEKEGITLHSFMVLRHGKVAAEVYKAPFSPDNYHMMYSVSKSFTSTAVAFAIEEGFLTLGTKYLDVFPERRPSKYDAYLEKLSVFDLITMQGGKAVSLMADKTKENWLDFFEASPWASEPGTTFLYISENMYVLCAMIQRVTGMTVSEFLTPRLYEPLGMETPYWETCPRGIETGGWGIFLKLEDFAKFTFCYANHGVFEGKQVIPEYWTIEGTRAIADNDVKGALYDSKSGYGYCFWRNEGYKNSYRADGMFSQFGIVFEDLDAQLILMAGNVDEQQTRDCIWRHFPKAFIDDSSEKGVIPEFKPFDVMPKNPRSFIEHRLNKKTLHFSGTHILDALGLPVGVLPLTAIFMEKDKAGHIDNVRFDFKSEEMLMTWSEGDEINTIEIGMDGKYRISRIVLGGIVYHAYSTGAWVGEKELEIHIRPIEVVAERILKFTFKSNKVDMRPSSNPSIASMLDNLKESAASVMPNEFVAELAKKVVPMVAPIVDPVHHGVIL